MIEGDSCKILVDSMISLQHVNPELYALKKSGGGSSSSKFGYRKPGGFSGGYGGQRRNSFSNERRFDSRDSYGGNKQYGNPRQRRSRDLYDDDD